VDKKTTTLSLNLLRMISAPEGVSFILLIIASVLKRTTDFNAVPVLGMIHGMLFVVYVVLWAFAWYCTRWNVKTAALYLVLSSVPLGGFVAERKLKRELEDGVIADRARREGVVNA
jgi:integral membrane protein